jgi:tRNA-5-methyluridine54 2-sulfurtransferase
MQCAYCDRKAVLDQRCKEHFIEYFEDKVRKTMAEHNLVAPGDRIAVAVSGGKDSLTVLTLLHKWFGHVTAIAVDEGIAGYRDKTLEDARRVCEEHKIPLVIKSYEELTGMTLDTMLEKRKFHPCTVCGTLRRHLLQIASRDCDVLATGHNADDEAQAVLMNIIKGNTELFARLGPSSGNGAHGFTRRIKPLYFCTEKEVMAYAFIAGLVTDFTECPNIDESYRHLLRDELNRYAQRHPGVRQRLLLRFLEAKQAFSERNQELQQCASCMQPSSKPVCSACGYIQMLRNV